MGKTFARILWEYVWEDQSKCLLLWCIFMMTFYEVKENLTCRPQLYWRQKHRPTNLWRERYTLREESVESYMTDTWNRKMCVVREWGRKRMRVSGWIVKLQSKLQLEVIWASIRLHQRHWPVSPSSALTSYCTSPAVPAWSEPGRNLTEPLRTCEGFISNHKYRVKSCLRNKLN